MQKDGIIKKAVQCDDCKKDFRIKRIRQKKMRDGVEGPLTISWFSCPHCKKKCVTFVESEKLRKSIRERKKLYAEFRLMDSEAEIAEVFKKIDKLDKEIKNKTHYLKFHFAKYV